MRFTGLMPPTGVPQMAIMAGHGGRNQKLIRDRFALVLAALAMSLLAVLAALAMGETPRRSIDIDVLWLAAALQLGLLVTWACIPRLAKWIVAGWGLILVALGVGVIISAPLPAGAGELPWALVGLVLGGVLTILAAVVHRAESALDA